MPKQNAAWALINFLAHSSATKNYLDRSGRPTALRAYISAQNEKVELVKGRNIILIDDIATTGATLNEARKILKQVGAGKIIAFTIAH